MLEVQLIFTLCQFGKQFFPEDSLVKIVNEIKQSNRFCKQSIELVKNIYYLDLPLEVLEQHANEAQFELTDTLNAGFDSDQMEKEAADWFNGGKERYINSIGICAMLQIPFDG